MWDPWRTKRGRVPREHWLSVGESFLSRVVIANYRRKGSRLTFLHTDVEAVTPYWGDDVGGGSGQSFLFCLTVSVRCVESACREKHACVGIAPGLFRRPDRHRRPLKNYLLKFNIHAVAYRSPHQVPKVNSLCPIWKMQVREVGKLDP